MRDLACHRVGDATMRPHVICLDETDLCLRFASRVAVPALGSIAALREDVPEYERVRR
jgi:hypothetical protein